MSGPLATGERLNSSFRVSSSCTIRRCSQPKNNSTLLLNLGSHVYLSGVRVEHGGIVVSECIILGGVQEVGVQEVVQDVGAFRFDCMCKGLFARPCEAMELGLDQATRDLLQRLLSLQWLLLNGRGVLICTEGCINLIFDLYQLAVAAALLMGVLDITPDSRVYPCFLRSLRSLYELCVVDLGVCLDEVIFLEIRPSGNPVVFC